MKITNTGEILEDNTLKMLYPARFKHDLKAFKPGKVIVTIETPKKSRSNQQNRYLHGVVFKIIGNELGYDLHEIKEEMKAMFLSQPAKLHEGKVIMPTSSLTTEGMKVFIDNICRWASSEFNIYIPPPDKAYEYGMEF